MDAIYAEGRDEFGSDDEFDIEGPETFEPSMRRSERERGGSRRARELHERARPESEERRGWFHRGAAHRDTFERTPSPPQLPPWYEGQRQPSLGRPGPRRTGEGRYCHNIGRVEVLHNVRDRLRLPPMDDDSSDFLYDDTDEDELHEAFFLS